MRPESHDPRPTQPVPSAADPAGGHNAADLYRAHGWSGCAGSAWENLPQGARDGWEYAARAVEQAQAEADYHRARADALKAKWEGGDGSYWAEWHLTHCAAMQGARAAEAERDRLREAVEVLAGEMTAAAYLTLRAASPAPRPGDRLCPICRIAIGDDNCPHGPAPQPDPRPGGCNHGGDSIRPGLCPNCDTIVSTDEAALIRAAWNQWWDQRAAGGDGRG